MAIIFAYFVFIKDRQAVYLHNKSLLYKIINTNIVTINSIAVLKLNAYQIIF